MAATETLITNSYDSTQYPFTLRHTPFPTYYQVNMKQFGKPFTAEYSNISQFPAINNITIGGMLDDVLFTGYLKIAYASASIMDNVTQ